jgi:hypothetical protein
VSSRGFQRRLAGLNITGIFLATIAFVLVALFAPGIVGGALLLLLAAALLGLMVMTWRVTAPRTRALRVVMLSALVAVAFVKILL